MLEQMELFNTMYGSTKSLIKYYGDNCEYLKAFSNYDTYSVNRVLSVLRNTQKKSVKVGALFLEKAAKIKENFNFIDHGDTTIEEYDFSTESLILEPLKHASTIQSLLEEYHSIVPAESMDSAIIVDCLKKLVKQNSIDPSYLFIENKRFIFDE